MFFTRLKEVNWKKVNGLLPAIIQSSIDQSVLMLGYMNSEAIYITQESGVVHFYSRTKQQIWKKGEKSGNTLQLVNMSLDCDNDALLVTATPKGYVCHKNSNNCFRMEEISTNWLLLLEKTIEKRIQSGGRQSYVRSLVEKGYMKIAQKVGEEGIELVIASAHGKKAEVIEESADLLFHLLINLKAHGLDLLKVVSSLQKRHSSKN